MVNCPRCGKEAKPTGKEWDYSRFHVKFFNCPYDNKNFKAYYLKGKLNHTIPSDSVEGRILNYLKKHGAASEEEIASELNLPIHFVLATIAELKRRGRIITSPET